jgi:hypothetical protein
MTITRLILLAAIAGAACAPGDLDPHEFPTTPRSVPDAAPAPTVSDQSPLAGCPQYPTLGAFEEGMIVPRCGTGTCHSTNGRPFAPDMMGRPVYPRLLDRKVMGATTACDRGNDRYIDSRAAPEDSYLVSKVRDDKPVCPDGKPAGARMPLGTKGLGPDEVACFVSYVRALTGR